MFSLVGFHVFPFLDGLGDHLFAAVDGVGDHHFGLTAMGSALMAGISAKTLYPET